MRRWLVLGLIGAGGCAGERPQFGTLRELPDATSQDGGSNNGDQASTNTSASNPSDVASTTDGSMGTHDESRTTTEAPPDDSTDGATPDNATSDSDQDSGTVDEEACSNGEVEACNECGQRSCDTASGEWGPCLPAEEPRCNETETALHVCDESGNWETQECTNPDAANCTTGCATPEGVAVCVVSAVDGDGDGYLSAACEKAPGDDCDDTTQSVSPGSFEVCDGQDNDCDGYADILDSTVSLTGAPILIRGVSADLRRIDIAWHASALFFVADGRPMSESDFTSIYSGQVSTDGSAKISEILATNHSDDLYDSPRLAAAGDTLGAIARRDGRHSYGTIFLTLDSSGAPLTNIEAQAWSKGTGAIGHSDSSFTIFSHDTPNSSHPFNTVSFAIGSTDGGLGAVATRDDIAGELREVNVAQANSVTGVVYTDVSEAPPSVQLLRWSEGNVLGPIELSPSAQSADIVALASGQFAIAWATEAGFRLQVRATNGTLICDSEQVEFGNGVLDSLDGVAVAESSLGIVVVVADSGTMTGHAEAFVLDEKCEPLTQNGKAVFNDQLANNRYRPHAPRIAVGGGNIAFAWTAEEYSGSYTSYIRVMPESMCEN